jgi:hypothetical protein
MKVYAETHRTHRNQLLQCLSYPLLLSTMYVIQDFKDDFYAQLTLCPTCLDTLRSKIDRLSILFAPNIKIY